MDKRYAISKPDEWFDGNSFEYVDGVHEYAGYIVAESWTTGFKGRRQVLYRQHTDEASWPSNQAVCMPRLKHKPQFTSAQELHHPATQVRRTRARLSRMGAIVLHDGPAENLEAMNWATRTSESHQSPGSASGDGKFLARKNSLDELSCDCC